MFRILSVILAMSYCFSAYAEERPLLSLSIPDISSSCAKFKQHPVGAILLGSDLAGPYAYFEKMAMSQSPEIYALVKKINRVDLELFGTGNKREPVGIRLQISGNFGAIPNQLSQMLQRGTGLTQNDFQLSENTILICKSAELKAFSAKNNGSDIEVHWDVAALSKIVIENAPNRSKASAEAALSFLPNGFLSLTISADKLHNLLQLDKVPAGSQAIDFSLIKKIPETSAGFACFGFNGKEWWAEHRGALSLIAAENMMRKTDPDSVEMAMNQINGMATMFLGTDLDSLMSDINGTFAVVLNENIISYPNLSFFLPRSTSLDTLITQLLTMGQQETPEPGTFEFLHLKNLNPMGGDLTLGALCLARDEQHWIISMDSQFTEAYLTGTEYDLSKRYYAPFLEQPEELMYLSAVNSDKGMTLALPHVFGVAANFFDQGQHGSSMAMAAHKIIKHAEPMISYGRKNDAGYAVKSEGISSFGPSSIALVAIVASIAIPNLMESKITANEGAAGAMLKSAFFASQVQFQAGGYQDADGNGVGEYGFIEHLNGSAACLGANVGDLGLLRGNDFRDEDGRNGYRFEIYLPNGPDSAHSFEDGFPTSADGIKMCERQYIIYAWPVDPNETGRRAFAMLSDGQLRSVRATELNGEAPAWNAAFGGGGWNDPVVWPFYSR